MRVLWHATAASANNRKERTAITWHQNTLRLHYYESLHVYLDTNKKTITENTQHISLKWLGEKILLTLLKFPEHNGTYRYHSTICWTVCQLSDSFPGPHTGGDTVTVKPFMFTSCVSQLPPDKRGKVKRKLVDLSSCNS